MGLNPSQKQSLYTINCQSTPICTSPPWFRVSGMCPKINDSITNDQLIMRRKAEVLQHKNNSANLTKKQKWSQMVRTNVKLGSGFPPGKYWTIKDKRIAQPGKDLMLPGGDWDITAKNARMVGQFLVANLRTDEMNSKDYPISIIKVNSPNDQFKNENGTFIPKPNYTPPPYEGTFIPPYCKYPSSASDVPGKIIDLYLDKNIQPWGVGPRRRSFAMGGLWTKFYAGLRYPQGYQTF